MICFQYFANKSFIFKSLKIDPRLSPYLCGLWRKRGGVGEAATGVAIAWRAMDSTAENTMHLPQILAHTREVVAERKAAADMRGLERAAAEHEPRGFARALRAKAAAEGLAVIAELKKASPSRGLIRAEFDAAALAAEMEAGGAAVLSVLTDERFFHGSLENLQRASAAVRIPCLRKDFMVDEFQVLEARANGADAILLIVAALTDAELRGLRESARGLRLDVLCEVHDAEELERALQLDCESVGVNSRDLRTFEVSLERACELVARLPASAVKVAESGIHTAADMQRLRAAGYEAFLIGESLMRQERPGVALAELLEAVRE
jgi:indole-3-glycerol phosphate synthase